MKIIKAISRLRYCLLFFLLRRALSRAIRALRRAQHIFNENSVSAGRIAHQHVRDSADKLAVLNDRGAAHECGQEGTTKFNRDLTVESINRLKLKQQVPFLKSFP